MTSENSQSEKVQTESSKGGSTLPPSAGADLTEHDASGGLRERFARLIRDVRIQGHWFLIFLAACIGTVTALGAVAFMWFLHFAQELFLRWPPFAHVEDGTAIHVPLWLLIVGPTVGAAICATIVVYGAPEAKGHGVPEVMVALYRRKGQIRPRVALFKSLASAFTIGSGGSAGAEGPIVQIGSAIGSNVGRLLGVGPEHTGTLLGCGAAAGIASVFNAPVAGIFFVLEILLRDFSIRTFTPIVIASVFSAAITQALHGYEVAIFAVPDQFGKEQFTIFELPYYILLGVVCGVVAVSFTRALDRTESLYERIRLPAIAKPISGAVIFGLMSIVIVLIARSAFGQAETTIPAYYGNGYPFIRSLLTGELFGDFDGIWILALGLLALVLLKMLATCMILGSGGSGGIFAPSLFIGAATGGAFGILVTEIDPLHLGAISPAAYALVGMAAVVSGTTHAPLTAILIVFEITTDYKVILPIMLAAAVATLIAQFLLEDSIYTLKVRRAGIRVGRLSDLTVLRRISVKSVPLSKPVKAHPDEPASRLLELAEFNNAADFVIVDENDRYLGMVTNDDLRTTLLQIEALPLLVVDELMRSDIPTTAPDETLDIVMDKFSQSDTATLPVLSEDDECRVLGMISRSRMMREYHLALDHP